MNLFKFIFSITILFFFYCNSYANLKPVGDFSQIELLDSDNEKLNSIKKLLEEGETQKALNELYSFINEVEKNNDTLLIVKGKLVLADVLRINGDYAKSNVYLNTLLPFVNNDLKNLQYVYFKKGGNFQQEGNIDSALVNYEKALIISENVENDENTKAKIHANLSGIYYLIANSVPEVMNNKKEQDSYNNKAIEHSKIAANFQKVLGNKEIEAGILNNLGGIYYMQGKHKEALKAFQEAFSIVGYGQEEIQKQTRCNSYINMAYAYSGLNDYEKAFEYQDKYFSLNDSLQQELKYKEIAEIESKYNVEKKEKEAEIEKSKRLKAEYLSIGLGLATVILLLGVYALYKLYKLSKKNHKLQLNQRQLMHQSKIDKLKSESQSKILVATLDGRLEERKKISEILHDNVSALLSAANLHLYASKKQLKDNVPIEIDKSQKIISEASEKIRDLSHKLMSSVLLKFGLSTAIQDLCDKSSNSDIQFRSESKNIERFNQNFEIKIFHIINELVNNILKHSNAKNGVIKLEQLNGKLQIVVFDDGKGFNVDEIQENNEGGIGLSQIEARIKALDGLISFKSTSDGTRVFMSVPIIY